MVTFVGIQYCGVWARVTSVVPFVGIQYCGVWARVTSVVHFIGIQYCGVWARVTSVVLLIFTWTFIVLGVGVAIYVMNFSNLMDMVLTPCTGEESYAWVIRSEYL